MSNQLTLRELEVREHYFGRYLVSVDALVDAVHDRMMDRLGGQESDQQALIMRLESVLEVVCGCTVTITPDRDNPIFMYPWERPLMPGEEYSLGPRDNPDLNRA